MRITKKQISKAIWERTGLDVQVYLEPNVSAHFYSDDESTDLIIHYADNGVEVARLSHLSLDQWVSELDRVWTDALEAKNYTEL